MRRDCITCKRPTILAREIDGNMIVLDGEQTDAGKLAVYGELDDQPRALWNFTDEDAEFWRVPANLPRFDPHRESCG